MNRELQKFDYLLADKLGKLLRGRKYTFSIAGESAPVAPEIPTPLGLTK